MTTATEVKTVYEGIEISYSERDDNWTFELRGKTRNAPSLAKAKEVIDTPAPVAKVPFARFQAYKEFYDEGFKAITVTSLSDRDYRGQQEFWITDNGKRSKEKAWSLYAHTPENLAVIERIAEARKQIAALNAGISELKKTLTPIETKDWE